MKHTLALVLMVFGLVGCATTYEGEIGVPYEELEDAKAIAVNIDTGEAFYVSGVSVWDPVDNANKSFTKAQLAAISLCDNNLNLQSLKREYGDNSWAVNSKKVKDSKCKVFKISDRVIYKDVDDYYAHMEAFKQVDKDNIEKQKQMIALRAEIQERGLKNRMLIQAKAKEQKIKDLIVRCEEFGFKGENNIAACVQREVQVDLALAKQEKKIDQLENRINSLAQSQESKKESSSSVLVDLLSIIAEEAERQNEMEDRVRLYKLESKVNAINSRNNAKQANCVLNRNC